MANKAIFKNKLGAIIRNISFAAILVLGISQTAKADQNDSYRDLSISCEPASNFNSALNCSFGSESIESNPRGNLVTQGSRGRRRKSKVQGYYGGFSLGAVLPTGGLELIPEDLSGIDGDLDVEIDLDSIDTTVDSTIDYGTGFAGSVFGGIMFTEKIGAELEFLIGIGGSDSDDFNEEFGQLQADAFSAGFNAAAAQDGLTPEELDINLSTGYEIEADYTIFALYASPRFDLPVSDKFTVYLSPGVGLSQTNISTETNNDISAEISGSSLSQAEIDAFNDGLAEAAEEQQDEQEIDLNKTGITFRVKAGVEYQISDTIDAFGQFSYATFPTEDSNQFEIDNINSFLAQGGLTFNF